MLADQLMKDYVQAMKDKNEVHKQALGYIVAQVKNKQKELQQDSLADDEVVTIIKKELKARQETIGFLQQANKAEELAQEEQVIALLLTYLPTMLTAEQLKELVQQVITQQNITDIPRQRGEIVKAIMADHKAVVDGKLLQEVIGEFM